MNKAKTLSAVALTRMEATTHHVSSSADYYDDSSTFETLWFIASHFGYDCKNRPNWIARIGSVVGQCNNNRTNIQCRRRNASIICLMTDQGFPLRRVVLEGRKEKKRKLSPGILWWWNCRWLCLVLASWLYALEIAWRRSQQKTESVLYLTVQLLNQSCLLFQDCFFWQNCLLVPCYYGLHNAA